MRCTPTPASRTTRSTSPPPHIGGPTWQGAGRIWYDVLTGGKLRRTTNFAGFAAATIEAARARFGPTSKQARGVELAWRRVKVIES